MPSVTFICVMSLPLFSHDISSSLIFSLLFVSSLLLLGMHFFSPPSLCYSSPFLSPFLPIIALLSFYLPFITPTLLLAVFSSSVCQSFSVLLLSLRFSSHPAIHVLSSPFLSWLHFFNLPFNQFIIPAFLTAPTLEFSILFSTSIFLLNVFSYLPKSSVTNKSILQ